MNKRRMTYRPPKFEGVVRFYQQIENEKNNPHLHSRQIFLTAKQIPECTRQ